MKPASKLISQWEAVVVESDFSDTTRWGRSACHVEVLQHQLDRANAQKGFTLLIYVFTVGV